MTDLERLPNRDKVQLIEISNQQLARRTLNSLPLHSLVFCIMMYFSNFYLQKPILVSIFAAMIVILTILRVIYSIRTYRKFSKKNWHFLLGTMYSFSVLWSIIFATLYCQQGLSHYVIVFIFIIAGTNFFSIAGIATDLLQYFIFQALMTVPVSIILVIISPTPSGLFLAAVVICSFIIALGMARKKCLEFWEAKVNAFLLSKRNMQLETEIAHNAVLEKKKEVLQKQVFQASKLASIGKLAAGVAHEINNPMVVVQANVDLIRDELERLSIKSERIERMLNMQAESSKRITEILSELNYYARSGDMDLDTAVSLDIMIEKSVLMLKQICKANNIEIVTQISSNTPTIKGMNNRLNQVLMNLLTNAKDSISGTGTITIGTNFDDENVTIFISDTGHGIADEDINNIFDAFYTTKMPGKGTGLGLNISYEIVKEMSGHIEVESEKGKGTTFRLVFPKDLMNISHDFFEETLVKEKVSFDKLSGRVLVVDDEIEICNVLDLYLGQMGLFVETVNSGEEALAKLHQSQFDILMTDAIMPDMSGNELVTKIEELSLGEKMKIIVISGQIEIEGPPDDYVNLKTKAEYFIQKPFTKSSLYDSLKKILKS